jgi:hypothetical protein
VLTPIAFQALIVTIRLISAATSSSLKCWATASYAAVGTWSAASRVTDSVKASAARSRSVKAGGLAPRGQRV